MKKLSICLFVLLIGCASARFTDLQNNEEFNTKGSKAQNYQKSLQWIASTFGSAKAVIEYQNQSEGKIIGNIITQTGYMGTSMKFKTLMTITVSNNKVKINLFAKELNQGGSGFREIYQAETDYARESFEPIFGSYKNYMK